MRKMGFIATVAAAATMIALTAGPAAASTPRWVTHVKRYPGGISNGVRAYTDPGLQSAQAAARQSGASSSSAATAGPRKLHNLQVNQDSSPPLPQNETQIVHNPFNDMVAVGAANDYVNGGSQLYRTTNGGQSWTTQDRSARVLETGITVSIALA